MTALFFQIFFPEFLPESPSHTGDMASLYIYIYIFFFFIYGCNLDWGTQKWPTSLKVPSFVVKMGNNNRHKIVAVSVAFLAHLSQFLCLFPLVVSPLISCCFMTSWSPQAAHQMRLQALW